MTVDTEWSGGEPTREVGKPERLGGDPRGNADDAYATFVEMDNPTFAAAYAQRNGMTVAEQMGIRRAAVERYATPVEGELVVPETLPNLLTGELLPATIPNAAAVIEAAREMKRRADDVIHAATGYAAEESRRLGKKTLPAGDRVSLVLSGGPTTEILPDVLREALAAADCPAERIEEAIRVKVEETVDRSVVRQLAAANPDYAAAIELATVHVLKSFSASVKR